MGAAETATPESEIELKPGAINSLTSPEFSAWVTINGKKVEVYGVEETLKTMSGSIESIEGAEFQVHFKDERVIKNHGVVAFLCIDGEMLSSFLVRKESKAHEVDFKGKQISSNSIRAFAFSKIQLTDDIDISCNEESVVKGLGTIQIRVLRADQNGLPTLPRVYDAVEKSKIMNEKSKKAALSHSTALGSTLTIPDKSTVNVTYIDSPSGPPYFTFEFAYRSRTLLEINGVIPSNDPVAGPSNHKKRAATGTIIIDSSDDDEDDEDPAAELARLRAENVKLKKAKLSEDKKPKLEKDLKPEVGKGKGKEVIVIDDD